MQRSQFQLLCDMYNKNHVSVTYTFHHPFSFFFVVFFSVFLFGAPALFFVGLSFFFHHYLNFRSCPHSQDCHEWTKSLLAVVNPLCLVNEIKCITRVGKCGKVELLKTVKQCNFNLHFIGSEFTVQWMQDYCNLLCTKHLWKYSVNKIILKRNNSKNIHPCGVCVCIITVCNRWSQI